MPSPRYIKLDKPRNFLLRDDFGNDETAPMVTPRRCEGGPGYAAIVDANSKISVSGGKLVFASGSTAGTDRYTTDTFTVIPGLAVMARITPNTGSGQSRLYMYSNTYGWLLFRTGSGLFSNGVSAAYPYAPTYTTGNAVWITTGSWCHWLIDNKLIWVYSTSPATVSPALLQYVDGTPQMDWIRVAVLGEPWQTPTGLMDINMPTITAGDTATIKADATVEMSWTAVTGETWNFMVRRTDDSNCWCVRYNQAGSTVKIIQVEGGEETERASAARTITNGQVQSPRVVMDGQNIGVFIGYLKLCEYTSASFNQTATGVKSDKNGINLRAWPRDLTGTAAYQELLRWTND